MRETVAPQALITAAAVVVAGLLLGRLAGFAREVLLASSFGLSAEADIAILALTIPDLLVTLMIAGGLSGVLVPEFKSLPERDGNALFWQLSLIAAILSLLLVALMQLYIEFIVFIFAPGFSQEISQRAEQSVSIALWLIPLTVLALVAGSLLQSREKFLLPSLGTFCFNFSVVIGLLFFVENDNALMVLAVFILLGGAIRWLLQAIYFPPIVFLGNSERRLLVTPSLVWRYCQTLSAAGLLVLIPVILRAYASLLGEGSVSAINFALKLLELPAGLVLVVLSTVLLSRLSGHLYQNQISKFNETVNSGFSAAMILSFAVAIPVAAWPELFVTTIYGWGKLAEPAQILQISSLAAVLAMLLPAQVFCGAAVVTFNARKEPHFNILVSFLGVTLILLYAALFDLRFGLIGMVFVVLFSYLIMSAMFYWLLARRGVSISLPVGSFLYFSLASFALCFFVKSLSVGTLNSLLLLLIGSVVGLFLIYRPSRILLSQVIKWLTKTA